MDSVNTIDNGGNGIETGGGISKADSSDKLLGILGQGDKNPENSELYGNKEAILSDLKEHHITFEENSEMMGYKGREIHIDLPEVGDFKGFEFDSFISNEMVDYGDLEANPELVNPLYSMDEVLELLEAFQEYMKECGVYMDRELGDHFLTNDRHSRYGRHKFETYDAFDEITKIKTMYGRCGLRLKDIGRLFDREKDRIIFLGNGFDGNNYGASMLFYKLNK